MFSDLWRHCLKIKIPKRTGEIAQGKGLGFNPQKLQNTRKVLNKNKEKGILRRTKGKEKQEKRKKRKRKREED